MLVSLAFLAIPLAAQDISPPAGPVNDQQLKGAIRTSGGVAIPGATLRLIETSSGNTWITWSDESGRFEFPALPADHFRVEISQLGFVSSSKEIDITEGVSPTVEWKLDVATLAEIEAANGPTAKPHEGAKPATAENAPTKGEAAIGTNQSANAAQSNTPGGTPDNASSGGPASKRRRTGGSGGAQSSEPGGAGGGQNGGPGGGRGGLGIGSGGPGQGGGRRAFQQVGLNGQDQTGANNEDTGMPQDTGGQLGQAASADAVQMIGTVAMGLAQNPMGGFPQPGDAGLDTQMGFGNNGYNTMGPGGPGGPAGPMGGGPGGPGGGPVMVMRGGGRGPGSPGGGPPPGVEGLWGAQRVMRQRINRVHYSFYDTIGDSALNARPYSLYEANPPKISGWTESAGMNIGGPLKIPHVYNGTDKTFFFINFGGTWSRNPVDSFASVPTAAERLGDFSAENVLLYDPVSSSSGPRNLMTNAGCQQDTANAAGTCIPQNRISQQALSLLNYIPAPNIPVTTVNGQHFNYHLQTNLPGLSNRLNANVTHQISSMLSLQVNYNFSGGTSHGLNNFPGIESDTFTRGQSVMIGLTQNWTKTFMHTSQLFFSRNRSLGLNEFSNLTDISSQLGLTGISSNPFDYGLPQIGLTNYTGLGDATPSLNRSQTYRYVDSLRWMKTKHTVTAGGEIRKMDINRNTDPAANGQFAFTGLMTSQLTSTGAPVPSPVNCIASTAAGPCIGSDLADFLLGFPANVKVQYGNTATYFRNWGFVGYASDDWHIVPKFTLTYGVRYEAFTPPTEIYGHIANLAVSPDFTSVQCVTPIATGNCVQGSSASLFNGHYNNWAPRVGIAWQPPGKYFSGNHQMTIRAGFSMFYVESYLNTLSSEMANQPPFATANTLTTQTVAASPLSFQTNLSTAAPGNLTNTIAVNPNYQVPYAMVWNTSIEYNLIHNTFLEVQYTGTRGVHLDELLGFGPTNLTANAAGFTYDTTGAFSILNSLQVRVQKRMSRGLMFMARYTYSKSMDDASTIGGGGQTVIQNNADPSGDYGLSSFDMRHQFLGIVSYQLPFGERQKYARKGWENQVFGAWRVNGNFTAHSGTPFTVRVFSKNPSCQNVPGVNSERADQASGSALANPTIQEWFNTAAFGAPTECFGDAPRNSVIGPGAFTVNSGVSKTFQFGRDGLRRLDFVWNANNIFNQVNYTGLSTVLGSSTFGQITGAAGMRSMTFTTRVNF